MAASIQKVDSDCFEPLNSEVCTCLLCDEQFSIESCLETFLHHLVKVHKLVIADVKLITDFKRYASYWKDRFKGRALTEFCHVIETNSDKDVDLREKYYLLCDALPEDKELRQQFQTSKLIEALDCQQREREDTAFNRSCLFCKQSIHGNRANMFNHLNEEHHFNVGLPDNIVFANDFLDLIQTKLDRLLCLYCEKTFKDKNVLKEHMRKKQHKRLNPKNQEYDKFYLINYLELGKKWEQVLSEDDTSLLDSDTDKDDDWSEWKEDSVAMVTCLFCDKKDSSCGELFIHMKKTHNFDFEQIKKDHELTFYEQVKVINYMRQQTHNNTCLYCQSAFSDRTELMLHMMVREHIARLPAQSVWNQPQYYFPIFEDDNLICSLEDGDTSTVPCVIVEDEKVNKRDSILSEQRLLESVISEDSVILGPKT